MKVLSVFVVLGVYGWPHSQMVLAAAPCSEPFRVQFFGDLYISDRFIERADSLFSGIGDVLQKSDFNVVNLEGVISSHNQRAFPLFPFSLKMKPEVAKILKKNKITHVTRANNHSMDYGEKGVIDTNQALTDQGIKWAGVGANINQALIPLIIEKAGYKVGVLSFTTTFPQQAWATATTPGVAYPTEPRLREAIKTLKTQTNYVIVSFHWGEEKNPQIRPHQEALAEIALDAGADSVLGHHAHVAQKITQSGPKKDSWIFYGLGNFIFTSRSDHADIGLGVRYDFCGNAGQNQSVGISAMALDTLNQRTNFVTRPIFGNEFTTKAKKYFDDQIFLDKSIFKDL